MGFLGSVLGILGFGIGIPFGLFIGFYIFIYSEPKDIKENATFEAALDWLYLNLAGNELPLKFALGALLCTEMKVFMFLIISFVGILSIAQDDWSPSMDSTLEIKDEMPEISVKVKGQRDVDTLESLQPS